jgi:hypothetical protein
MYEEFNNPNSTRYRGPAQPIKVDWTAVIVLGIVLCITLGFLGYMHYTRKKDKDPKSSPFKREFDNSKFISKDKKIEIKDENKQE